MQGQRNRMQKGPTPCWSVILSPVCLRGRWPSSYDQKGGANSLSFWPSWCVHHQLCKPAICRRYIDLWWYDIKQIWSESYVASRCGQGYAPTSIRALWFGLHKSSMVWLGRKCLTSEIVLDIFGCKEDIFHKIPWRSLWDPESSKGTTGDRYCDKLEQRLEGWKGNTLSMGGKLILVNSTLLASPIYLMSFFIWL